MTSPRYSTGGTPGIATTVRSQRCATSSEVRLRSPRSAVERGIGIRTASLDRIFAINAFHHFVDKRAFAGEARRVLRPAGRLLTIGLDPHTGLDQWWVYDYFPAALAAD